MRATPPAGTAAAPDKLIGPLELVLAELALAVLAVADTGAATNPAPINVAAATRQAKGLRRIPGCM
jgi:hypothetical protein